MFRSLLSLEKLPRAVDGPVTKVAVTGEAKRARCQWMGEEIADQCCGGLVLEEEGREWKSRHTNSGILFWAAAFFTAGERGGGAGEGAQVLGLV